VTVTHSIEREETLKHCKMQMQFEPDLLKLEFFQGLILSLSFNTELNKDSQKPKKARILPEQPSNNAHAFGTNIKVK